MSYYHDNFRHCQLQFIIRKTLNNIDTIKTLKTKPQKIWINFTHKLR